MFSGHRLGMTLLATTVVVVGYAGILTLLGWLTFRNSRVESAPGQLTIRNLFGLTHVVAPHHLGRTVLIENVEAHRGGRTRHLGYRLYVLDADDRAVLRWTENMWSRNQMRELASSLELDITTVPTATLAGIRSRYRRALRFNEAHPTATLVIFFGILVAIVASVGVYASTLPN